MPSSSTGVGRRFGALAALADITMRSRAGERRAVLGSNGAGKTTLFNTITGDFAPSSRPIRFFGEDITRFPDPRAHPPRPAAHLPDLAALRRPQRDRLRLPRLPRRLAPALLASSGPRADDATMEQASRIVARGPPRGACRDRWSPSSATASSASSRSRSRFAGAPRFILFDEPAAGLSPHERRDLVDILNALPAHIGYIIIEHDLDVALRVSERVTMMHNGRILKEGTPEEIENDPEVQEIYLGGGHG